ncbi:Unknown protein sequence [Pseudomonas savastanoi pv. phaseolicola]|nr:Unknown protein sequence [Pseudomonas savastanoi pv. phaseolicola]
MRFFHVVNPKLFSVEKQNAKGVTDDFVFVVEKLFERTGSERTLQNNWFEAISVIF